MTHFSIIAPHARACKEEPENPSKSVITSLGATDAAPQTSAELCGRVVALTAETGTIRRTSGNTLTFHRTREQGVPIWTLVAPGATP
jgi:hypothetical protein